MDIGSEAIPLKRELVNASVESVSQGFKKTEIGIIPEEWSLRSLSEIGQCLIGLTYDPRDIDPGGVLVLRSSNISDSSLQFGNDVYVKTSIPDRLIVRENDLLICVRNGSRPLIGKCALIGCKAAGMTFGAFMSVFRSDDSSFVYQCFQSDIIRRQIRRHLGATINQITNKSLNSFTIPYPDSQERRAVIQILSDVDSLVSALNALIVKKRAIMQVAMHQLLTGETRLPGFDEKWDQKQLGELGEFSKGRGVKRNDVSDDGLPCILYGELYTRYNNHISGLSSRISPKIAARALPIKTGDLLFAGSGESPEDIGRCATYLGSERAFAGGDIIVLRPSATDSMFLGYLMNHPSVTAQKTRLGQGNAVVHISVSNLAQVNIKLPSLPEQRAISTVLSDMDVEIAALKRRLKKLQAIKQGMMQELLTGRLRLFETEG